MARSKVRQGAELIHSFLALRKAVGLIALVLPFVLLLVHGRLDSVSESYYTNAGALFVGFLCAIGVFLLFYRGYDGRDRTTSAVAGVCAIFVSQIPCGCGRQSGPDFLWGWAAWYHDSVILKSIHFGSAALMFAALAYFCLGLFPETDKRDPGHQKRRRNWVYRVCGLMIVGMMAAVAIDSIAPWLHILFGAVGVFWTETIMIVAFGVSWAVKGEAVPFLNDRAGDAGSAAQELDPANLGLDGERVDDIRYRSVEP